MLKQDIFDVQYEHRHYQQYSDLWRCPGPFRSDKKLDVLIVVCI